MFQYTTNKYRNIQSFNSTNKTEHNLENMITNVESSTEILVKEKKS